MSDDPHKAIGMAILKSLGASPASPPPDPGAAKLAATVASVATAAPPAPVAAPLFPKGPEAAAIGLALLHNAGVTIDPAPAPVKTMFELEVDRLLDSMERSVAETALKRLR